MSEAYELTASAPHDFDRARTDAFAERMTAMLNDGALTVMISLGHRTGLFDAMAELPPAPSAAIAAAAELDERYVREWLGAMVTGRIVHYTPEKGYYHLPAEHAAWLTRAARPNNLAVTAQNIPLLAGVEDAIVERFREGGGVPYEAFSRFHEIMAEESDQFTVAALFDDILPLGPGVAESLIIGVDVLDVGCGAGRAVNAMAAAFPNSRFTGYDLSPEGVARARAEAAERGLTNAHFAVQDMTTLEEVARYDLVTAFDALHDQADPRRVLANLARSLRPDGVLLAQEIGLSSHLANNVEHPFAPFIYTTSCLHCMTVSLAQGGHGLGAAWGTEQAVSLMEAAGFVDVAVKRLPENPINCFLVGRRP